MNTIQINRFRIIEGKDKGSLVEFEKVHNDEKYDDNGCIEYYHSTEDSNDNWVEVKLDTVTIDLDTMKIVENIVFEDCEPQYKVGDKVLMQWMGHIVQTFITRVIPIIKEVKEYVNGKSIVKRVRIYEYETECYNQGEILSDYLIGKYYETIKEYLNR